MSAIKFTPGPWISDGDRSVFAKDGNKVADCEATNITDAEITANASLIAAAPDLYSALERFMAADKAVTQTTNDQAENFKAINELIRAQRVAAAALFKAHGEAA